LALSRIARLRSAQRVCCALALGHIPDAHDGADSLAAFMAPLTIPPGTVPSLFIEIVDVFAHRLCPFVGLVFWFIKKVKTQIQPPTELGVAEKKRVR